MSLFNKLFKSRAITLCEIREDKINLSYSNEYASININEIDYVEFEYDFAQGLMASVIFKSSNGEVTNFNGHILFEAGVIENIQKVLPGFPSEEELRSLLEEAPMWGAETLWSKSRA